MKSAMVTRQGSFSRLQGPRSLGTSGDGSPRRRGNKSVTFDKTDEVIQYMAATPEISEDNWDQMSLESCDSDMDGRPLPSLPPFLVTNASPTRSSPSRDARQLQLKNTPRFQAKLAAPLGETDDDFDFGAEENPKEEEKSAEDALATIEPMNKDKNADSSLGSTSKSLLPSPLQSEMSPIIDRPGMDLRMDAIFAGGSGMSPSLTGSGSWHRRTDSQASDFSDGGSESYFPVRRISNPHDQLDPEEPAKWRDQSDSALARQDSLQDSQRHPPTQVLSDRPLPAPPMQGESESDRAFMKRKRQLLQMLDPHGAGTAQSVGFTAIPEEVEESDGDVQVERQSSRHDAAAQLRQIFGRNNEVHSANEANSDNKLNSANELNVDVGDDSYWRGGFKRDILGYEETGETSDETPNATFDSTQNENTAANQSIGISREPAARIAAGFYRDMDDSDAANMTFQVNDPAFKDSLPPKPDFQHRFEDPASSPIYSPQISLVNSEFEGNLDAEASLNLGSEDEEADEDEDEDEDEIEQKNRDSEGGRRNSANFAALDNESVASAGDDTALQRMQDDSNIRPLGLINDSFDFGSLESPPVFPSRIEEAESSSSLEASQITYFDTAQLDDLESESDSSISQTDAHSQADDDESAFSVNGPVEGFTEPPVHVASSSPKSKESSVSKEIPKAKPTTYPGVLPWDPSLDTTLENLAAMPTPEIPQRSPERSRRSLLLDRSMLSSSPYKTESPDVLPANVLPREFMSREIFLDHKDEPAKPREEPSKKNISIGEWEPELDDEVDEVDEDEDDGNEDEDEQQHDEVQKDEDEEAEDFSDSANTVLKHSISGSQADDPGTNNILAADNLAADNLAAEDASEKSIASIDSSKLVNTNADETSYVQSEDLDPEVLEYIANNSQKHDESTKVNVRDVTPKAAEPTSAPHHSVANSDVSSPDDSGKPSLSVVTTQRNAQNETQRKGSTASLRNKRSFVPIALPSLSPINVSTSPFIAFEEELKEPSAPQAARIDELVSPNPSSSSPADPVGRTAGLLSPPPAIISRHAKTTSLSPSIATDNGESSILKDMSLTNEELSRFQEEHLLEKQQETEKEPEEEHADSYEQEVQRGTRTTQPELDSDLSDFESDAAAKNSPEKLVASPVHRDRDISTLGPKPELSPVEQLPPHTIEEADYSIREPSFGENMASTMMSLFSNSDLTGTANNTSRAVSQQADFTPSRHSYTIRESGSYVIATSPRKQRQRRSQAYEVLGDDESAYNVPQQPVQRNRNLPDIGNMPANSMPRAPSNISQSASSNYSLANGTSTNSVPSYQQQSFASAQRQPLQPIQEPEEDKLVSPSKETSSLKAIRLRPSTKFAKQQAPPQQSSQRQPAPQPAPQQASSQQPSPSRAVQTSSVASSPQRQPLKAPAELATPQPSPTKQKSAQRGLNYETLDSSTSPQHQRDAVPHRSPTQQQRNLESPRVEASFKYLLPGPLGSKQNLAKLYNIPTSSSAAPLPPLSVPAEEEDISPVKGEMVQFPPSTHELKQFAHSPRSSSSVEQFPKGLLYLVISRIEMLADAPASTLATLYIDNGVHCITSKALPLVRLHEFEKEYRIGFMQDTPVTATLRLSLPEATAAPVTGTQRRTSLSQWGIGSDGSFALFDLLPLRKSSYGSRQSQFVLEGKNAWAKDNSRDQRTVATITATSLYLPCISCRETPPVTLEAAEARIARARAEFAGKAPRNKGMLKQFGGELRSRNGKQRWVILDPVSPLLVAHSARTKRPRVLINIAKAISVTSAGGHYFEIQFKNRDKLAFRAPHASEVNAWISAIRSVIGKHENSRPKWIDAILYETGETLSA